MAASEDTIVVFTTDNGAGDSVARRWPDSVRGRQGDGHGGGLRRQVPAILRRPGKVPAGKVENGIVPDSTGSRLSSPPRVMRALSKS